MAAVAVVMPHKSRPELMARLGGFDVLSWLKLDLFNGMIVGGLIPSADLALAEFRKVLAEMSDKWWDDNTSYAMCPSSNDYGQNAVWVSGGDGSSGLLV
ncbi:hypothetical protein ABE530_11330 [Brucella sp. TWI559]